MPLWLHSTRRNWSRFQPFLTSKFGTAMSSRVWRCIRSSPARKRRSATALTAKPLVGVAPGMTPVMPRGEREKWTKQAIPAIEGAVIVAPLITLHASTRSIKEKAMVYKKLYLLVEVLVKPQLLE